MPIEVRQFPCLSDNYGFLVRDTATGDTAAVDTPDGEAVLRELEASGWRLSLILNTHWHPDHTQGNAEVKAATGAQIVGPAAQGVLAAELERLFRLLSLPAAARAEAGESPLLPSGGSAAQYACCVLSTLGKLWPSAWRYLKTPALIWDE